MEILKLLWTINFQLIERFPMAWGIFLGGVFVLLLNLLLEPDTSSIMYATFCVLGSVGYITWSLSNNDNNN